MRPLDLCGDSLCPFSNVATWDKSPFTTFHLKKKKKRKEEIHALILSRHEENRKLFSYLLTFG